MADLIVDFHSGGTATQYVDSSFLCLGADAEMNVANLELAEVFGAPFTMVCPIGDFEGDFDTTANLQKTRFLSCELGGLGGYSPTSFNVGWTGISRILAHEGIVEGSYSKAINTCFLDVGAGCNHCTADHHALAQLNVSLGDRVSKGDPVATLFDAHNFGEVRAELHSEVDGWVAVCRRNPLVEPGDHLSMICPEIRRSQLP